MVEKWHREIAEKYAKQLRQEREIALEKGLPDLAKFIDEMIQNL